MKSRYIDGLEIPEFDARISEAVDTHADNDRGKTMVIAVENLTGEVYRVIHIEGMQAFLGMTGALESMPLTDVLYSQSSASREGYDCRFSASPEQSRHQR